MNRTRRRGSRLILTLLACLVAGCGEAGTGRPVLRVAAASDLQHALPILIAAFRQDHDVEVEPTLAASGQLAEQIRQGAPYDVFLSADRRFVAKLAQDGSIDPRSVRPYARGVLVLAISDVSDPVVEGLEDLARPEVRAIAIGNPETAPYGRAARQALERAGLWAKLEPKIVPAESVRKALGLVESGDADVAIVGRSIADVPKIRAIPLPAGASDPIVQYLGVSARAARPDDARAFADFVTGEVGQGILRSLGFLRLPGPEAEAPPAER